MNEVTDDAEIAAPDSETESIDTTADQMADDGTLPDETTDASGGAEEAVDGAPSQDDEAETPVDGTTTEDPPAEPAAPDLAGGRGDGTIMPDRDGDPTLLARRALERPGRFEQTEVTVEISPTLGELSLADKVRQLNRVKLEKQSADREYNKQIKDLEAEITELSIGAEQGFVTRKVEAEVFFNWDAGVAELYEKTADGSIGMYLHSRRITPDEREQRLRFEEDRHIDDREGMPDAAPATPKPEPPLPDMINKGRCNGCHWTWIDPLDADACPNCGSRAISYVYDPGLDAPGTSDDDAPESTANDVITILCHVGEFAERMALDAGITTAEVESWTQAERDEVYDWAFAMISPCEDEKLLPVMPAVLQTWVDAHPIDVPADLELPEADPSREPEDDVQDAEAEVLPDIEEHARYQWMIDAKRGNAQKVDLASLDIIEERTFPPGEEITEDKLEA